MAASSGQASEGKLAWLLVGLTACCLLVVPLWIRYGGPKQGPLPFIPSNPVATLGSGQKIAFAAGDLAAGDSVLCENKGVLVGAVVPKPGHTTRASFTGSDYTSSIEIKVRHDSVVIARCS